MRRVRLKRVYEPPAGSDGCRVLVERLWPRGLSKEAARVDLWLKDVAPSSELRRWFGHDPEQWLEFKRRCFEELKEREDAVEVLRARARSERVTFVFASREVEHNNAVALKEYLESVRRVSG